MAWQTAAVDSGSPNPGRQRSGHRDSRRFLAEWRFDFPLSVSYCRPEIRFHPSSYVHSVNDFPRFPTAAFPSGPGRLDPRWLGAAALLVLLAAGLARGIYTVGPESVGVIQRFGRFVGTVQAKLPVGLATPPVST
jgi:hypothetical protein